ncbi:energy transducer TonB [Mucilaginibacter rigui]|uniref:Energy transducer TonB n=1 Tax=Mucilaginibacter rigui TaxID=534635 RepID=A0ABR7X6W9_9SPHI|nr:M56 family metallopeptidase [Mucilaginibacter rigui]MBD1386333.1 energy transducer TonB [Mucilaginibacter rigui]
MSWLHYLIEANIYLGVFYLCYCLFLNRDTHYTLGRVYLIFSCIIAFILPLTQLSILKPVIPEIEILEPVSQVTAIPVNVQQVKLEAAVQHFTFDDAVIYLYITGVVIAFLALLFRLHKLYILTRNHHSLYQDKYKLISLSEENTAFSFFNYLFIGSNVPQAQTVIAHEMVHIRQKHSVDIIFLEILKVINWFNPFIYLTQRSLKTIHEYIADEQTAAQEQDAITYSSFLLNNAYGIQGASIAHSFFNYNLLKKRIIMLNKNRSGKLARLKYLAALPLCAGMLCTSTLVFSKDYGLIDLAPREVVKPVIDSVKYALKLTDIKTNMWQVSDKIGITDKKNGSESFYTVNSLTEKDKADFKKRGFEIAIVEREKAKTDTVKKKLMPPPVIVPDKPAKREASIYSADKNGSALVIAPQPPATDKTRLAPPPPYEAAYIALYKHMAKTLRYPQLAKESKTDGNVILSYRLNTEHTITDIQVEKGIGKGCDEAAVNALKSFTGTVDKTPGKYYMATVFALKGFTKKYQSLDDYRSKPNFAGVVVTMGNNNIMPPPPPPAPSLKPPRVDQIKFQPPAVKPDKPAKVGKIPPPPPIEKMPKVTQIVKPIVVVSDEPTKKVKVDQIKLASSVVVVSDEPAKKIKVDQIKLASPVVIVSDEPAKKVKVDQIKLASPVVVSDEPAKTPPVEKQK